MNTPRLYIEDALESGAEIALAAAEAYYVRDVMRMRAGDELLLFNGRDGEFRARVAEAGKRRVALAAGDMARAQEHEKLPDVELIFAPIRHNRQDFLIEKATELGARILSPAITRNASVKGFNAGRARAIAKEAAEQSERMSVPVVNEPAALSDKLAAGRALIYLDERRETASPGAEALSKFRSRPVSFLIGPEGGFAPDEFSALEKSGATGITLGRLILRSETAAAAILSLYNLGK